MGPESPQAWLQSLQPKGIDLGLTRVRRLLKALGNPHRRYRTVMVTGTNGKGSTAAMLASILTAANLRTGLFTSPALCSEREQWTVNGAMLDADLITSCIDDIRTAADRTSNIPTYFEALTLVAYLAFARAECEIAVIEVGMGGRTDATNVTKPVAALITPVGLDHTEFLGNTIRKIAREKAGVIHRGTIALTSNDDPDVLDVIRKRAEKFGNRFIHVTEEHDSPLQGAFQRRNAGLAVRAARELGIGDHAIEDGVRNTKWRGRLEHRVLEGKDVWIDGAHNAHAIRAVVPFLDETVPRPRVLVFGIMSDKDVAEVQARLYPLFNEILTTEPYAPRCVPAAKLGGTPIPNPDDAFRAALQAPARAIVVAGSLYLAGAAIAFFDKIARP